MLRILVIDPDADLYNELKRGLDMNNLAIEATALGREGLERASRQSPDLILLELALPDMRGLDVCKALKREKTTAGVPIVVISARDAETDRVLAFEFGAADYVTKPFSVRELSLRVRRLLRAERTLSSARGELDFGVLKVDPLAYRAWVAGREVALTALEFRLLLTLCSRLDRVQTRELLLEDVWGRDACVLPRTVDAYVKRLRHKLRPAERCIETVRGVGYRFNRMLLDSAKGGAGDRRHERVGAWTTS